MANVTPKQIYISLRNAGATKIQAIGIMANGINESTLNPEAVGDQGTSFGFVQEHGTQYAGLVTGNPPKDLGAQIRVLAQNGGFRAASGNTAGAAAGNFAANYERCVGCQQGGPQWKARIANAAVVAGWVTSGKWPAASPGPSSGVGTGSAADGSSSSGTGNDCAFGPKLPVVGQVCLVKRATIRHMVGGALMVGGFGVGLSGMVIVLVYGLRVTGALSTAANAAAVVPGGGRAAERLTGVQARITRTGAQVTRERTQERAAQRRTAERAQRQQQAAGQRTERQRAAAGRRQAAEAQRRERAASRRYTVTEREPMGGEMGGTRTVRYQTGTRPAREAAG